MDDQVQLQVDVLKISFGIIVLNGEPFTRYCLRQIYPFAHQIIVVEGACEGSRENATSDGHSTDGTLDVLRQLQAEEDAGRKIVIVTAEDEGHPSGFWPGEKDEQSQAYAKRATGDYLWQVDIDEFYQEKDIEKILDFLTSHQDITAISFKQIQFWGGFNSYVDGWYLKRGGEDFHRIFKWGHGYKYLKHRPPTVVTDKNVDTRQLNWVDATNTAARGVYLYHYSLVFPKQVRDKSNYYSAAAWAKRTGSERWAEDNFMKLKDPFRVHNVFSHPSWLQQYDGTHPSQIEMLRRDIDEGKIEIECRETGDIQRLLSSKTYKIMIYIVKRCDAIDRVANKIDRWLKLKKEVAKGHVKLLVKKIL